MPADRKATALTAEATAAREVGLRNFVAAIS